MSSANNATPSSTAVDLAVLRDMFGDDIRSADKFIQRYLEHSYKQVAELDSMLERKDWPALGTTVHKLKSSSRMLGAIDLGTLCEALEEQSISPINKPSPPDLERLRAMHRQVCEELAQLISVGKL